jgi:CheY-like chemotaxis protein/HPt (histidine-containing phosphotransfer) domain-containing protein
MPYAKVLVVDDVQTNLRLAKGLLQTYGMTVDCVTSGQQAVDLLHSGATRYNAVFMDHMMPGMDGVETLRRIRAIDSDHARSVPVIVLTANVIAGNERIFLDHGFQAFLSKPIDPSKLAEVLNKWVKDARREVRPDSPLRRWNDVPPLRPSIMPVHAVEGLNITEGVRRCGSEAMFLDVLRSYAVNTPQLLEQMRRLAETDLAEYGVIAHGIKGASRGVGANALGDMAQDLEHAVKNNDWRKAREGFPPFLEAAEKLLCGIGELLHELMPAAPEENKPLRPAPDPEELAALHKASLSCSHSVMEEHLHKLEQYRYQSGGELVIWLRERVDAFDYALINERLAEYSS